MKKILLSMGSRCLYAGILVCASRAAYGDCDPGPISIANHTAEFRGVLYDDPNPGESTWFYSFTSGTKPAISHVTFALGCPIIQILDAGMWNGEDTATRLSKAGMPEPRPFPASPAGDPTTGIVGLKFDLGFEDHATHHYYFTVNGNYAAEPMAVALKAGPGFDTGELCGPAADCGGGGGGEPELGSIGDTVWLDADADGIQDPDEQGVAGVTVILLSEDGEELKTTQTCAIGRYLFDALVDGTYKVRFVLPDGTLFTEDLAGENRAVDSDADPLTGITAEIVLAPGEARDDIDAGLVESVASISLLKTGVFHEGTSDVWSGCTVFGPTHVFNALVFGDFSATGGDTDGRLAVGGNAVIPEAYSVGYGFYGQPIPALYGGLVDMFIVGGDLTDGIWGVNGNIVHGGERTGPRRWLSDGNVVRKVCPVTFRKDGNVPSDGSGVGFPELRSRLLERSDAYASLADRGVATVDVKSYQLVLTGEDPDLNVFNLHGSQWGGESREILLTAPSNATVLINVHGASVGITNCGMRVVGTRRERVLMHYVDAEILGTAGFTHSGSVLAIHADARFSGGTIEGRAVFGGSVDTSNGFEFHNYPFEGAICTNGAAVESPPYVHYSFTVVNTGNEPLHNVGINDPLVTVEGGPITLQPGQSDSHSFSAVLYPTDEQMAAGALTNRAEAVAETLSGNFLQAYDTHVVIFPEQEPEPPVEPPLLPEPENESWMKADFFVQSVDLEPSPSIVGTRFKARVRIVNQGHIPGTNVPVNLWSGQATYADRPSTPPDDSATIDGIGSGEIRVVEFSNLRAPFRTGTFHAMAVVNGDGTIAEYSSGNNHGGATYTLDSMKVDVTPGADGVVIAWNSVSGYYYFVERADALDQPFRDIADNIPATPPLNTYLDPDAPGGTAFYRVWGYKP